MTIHVSALPRRIFDGTNTCIRLSLARCESMKLFARYFTCCLVTVFIVGSALYKQYFKARRLENVVGATKTIGRYVHPFNSSIKGFKEFHFAVNTFELFTRLTDELESGITVNNISVSSYTKHLQPVTAISSNHYIELMARIDLMVKFLPENVSIIVYDLGLQEHQVEELRNIPFVAYRVFEFSYFPQFVRDLGTYAWKLLVIQKILSEFGGVMWLDACVVFQESYEKLVQYMVENNSCFLYFFKRAANTIISGSEPRILEFLPMRGAKEMTNRMPQSGAMLVYNTELVRRDIMKWALGCSLIKDCIAPAGSTHECGDNYPPDKFGGCHLFDQSLLAITVSNAYDSQEEKYTVPEELSLAYPWRVRDDNLLLSKEFVIVYIIWALVVTLIMSIIRKGECFIPVKHLRTAEAWQFPSYMSKKIRL